MSRYKRMLLYIGKRLLTTLLTSLVIIGVGMLFGGF